MIPATDRWGNYLEDLIRCGEDEVTLAAAGGRVASAAAVVRKGEAVLMVYNLDRQAWEIPGGGMEAGETPRQCVIRELKEETGQTAENLTFRGLQKLMLKPDESCPEWRPEYGAIYEGRLAEMRPFRRSDEISEIRLWDLKTKIGEVNPIDLELIARVTGGEEG